MLNSMSLPERFSGPVFRAYAWMMGSMTNWGPSGNLPTQDSACLSGWKWWEVSFPKGAPKSG